MHALISVSNKDGLESFAQALHELGYTILSTGKTANYLRNKNVSCQEVAEFTGVEEIFAGRVKTLHLRLCAGVLFEPTSSQQQDEASRHDIVPISLVAINFYPLSASVDNIDVGGPTLLRAAAKNYRHVVAVCDPVDYQLVISKLQDNTMDDGQRRQLAEKVFRYSANYEQQIYQQMSSDHQPTVPLRPLRKLRYGENPNQQAGLYVVDDKLLTGFADIKQLQGAELSYNNLLDLDAGTRLVQEFDEPAVAIIKHNNPCGVANGDNDLAQLFTQALAGDSKSAFGGIIVTNRVCNDELAETIGKSFYEALLAVDVEDSARKILLNNKRLRVVVAPWLNDNRQQDELRTVTGAYLYQQCPTKITDGGWQIANRIVQSPLSIEQKADLLFALRVVAHARSNAIVIAKDRQLLACCGGQTSRIDAVLVAISKGLANGHQLNGSILASDGFFPFDDWLAPVAEQGIVAVVQPGGSINDQQSIDACDQRGITMIVSGQRYFRH